MFYFFLDMYIYFVLFCEKLKNVSLFFSRPIMILIYIHFVLFCEKLKIVSLFFSRPIMILDEFGMESDG